MKSLLLATFFAATLAAAAHAQDDPGCWVEAPISEALVRDAVMNDLTGYTDSHLLAGYISGALSATRETEAGGEFNGTVLFRQDADAQWRAFVPRPGEDIVATYAVEGTGEAVLITHWTTEGPSPNWTLVHTKDSFATATCTNIDFPEELNLPAWANEWLSVSDFDIAANGRGELIGTAEWERDRPAWFVYRTRDHGATWSTRRKLSRERQARGGRFTPQTETAPPEALAANLQRFAAGR